MFECQVSLLSVACIFKPAQLLIAFQQQVTYITMHKNDGLENYLQKQKKNYFFYLYFSHSGDSVSLAGVCESGSISGRLMDGPVGFTFMQVFSWQGSHDSFSHVPVVVLWFFVLNFVILKPEQSLFFIAIKLDPDRKGLTFLPKLHSNIFASITQFCLKPNRRIYMYLLTKYSVRPKKKYPCFH